jgi:hypothetical protein
MDDAEKRLLDRVRRSGVRVIQGCSLKGSRLQVVPQDPFATASTRTPASPGTLSGLTKMH